MRMRQPILSLVLILLLLASSAESKRKKKQKKQRLTGGNASKAYPNTPVYVTFRDFLDYHYCSITKKAGRVRLFPVPIQPMAKWDNVEIRCRHLNEVFMAALCRNDHCNIGEYGMMKPRGIILDTKPVFASSMKPRGIILDTKPVFASRYINGLDPHKMFLVPIACTCQVRRRQGYAKMPHP